RPAVPEIFAYPEVHLFLFLLTLLCHYFSLTLLRPYFFFRSCCALILFSLNRVPCSAFILMRTPSAAPLIFYARKKRRKNKETEATEGEVRRKLRPQQGKMQAKSGIRAQQGK